MNIIKDGKVLEVTEKAFDVIYKEQGYVPYNSDNVKHKDKEEVYNDLTKADIIEKLEEQEIEHSPKATKKELFDILGSE